MEIQAVPQNLAREPKSLLPQVSRSCLLCGANEKSVRYEARLPELKGNAAAKAMHYQYDEPEVLNRWHYRAVQCKRCGHQYADPIFSQDVVESSYLLQDHDNEFGIDPHLLRLTNRAYADLMRPFLPAASERDLQVDIGCDTGIFLQQSADLGFKKRIGIEPGVASAAKAQELPGVEIKQKIFDPNDFAVNSMNCVSLVHVLDHLVDPRHLIKEVRPRMAKDGVIMAVVHNIESLVAKISRESWAPLNLVHMDYFTPSSLSRLFELEGYRTLAVVGTKNYFPLHHLVRFAPFIPQKLRTPLVKLAQGPVFGSMVLGLKLGNIAIIATPE